VSERAKITGRATPQGTKRLADRFKMDGSYRTSQGLSWSTIGLGTYLGEMDDATDRAVEAAVAAAHVAGVNHFDAAINYRGQRAERALGRALATRLPSERERAEVIVSTKGGILPVDGEGVTDPGTYVRRTYIEPGIVAEADLLGGAFCFAPDFLEFSLGQSLDNLGLETVDVYYLHNVEFAKPALGEEKFAALLRAAFTRLEELVVAGRIGGYGLATWIGLRANPGHPGHLHLEEVLAIAESVAGGGHHLRFVMAPLSLVLPEAMDIETQRVGGQWMTLVEAARRLAVGVIGSSPMAGGNLAGRWGGVPAERCDLVAGMPPMQQALQFARSVPGVLSTLSGMKDPRHVADNLALFSGSTPWEPEDLAEFIEAAQG
jgi:aryl-alcohol dehydrogenase-like predicted oxidoreductase